MTRVILASTSTIRHQLLKAAGIEVIVVPPGIDEEKLTRERGKVEPAFLAQTLASEKAITVSNRSGTDFVVGADQVLECEGLTFGKPATLTAARDQLLSLRNREHTLHSAVCVAQHGVETWQYGGTARLAMRDFSNSFLESYLEQMGPDVLTSVGSYKIEGPAVQLFERIEGDYFTILGLPLFPLLQFFREGGVIPS